MTEDDLARIVLEQASGDASQPRFADRVSVGAEVTTES